MKVLPNSAVCPVAVQILNIQMSWHPGDSVPTAAETKKAEITSDDIMYYAVITIAIRQRYDYDPTTAHRARLLPFDANKKWTSIFRRSRIVVVSQSNRTHIAISITFVVVESSWYRRIVVVSYSGIAIVIYRL